jgi:hypothetical protein
MKERIKERKNKRKKERKKEKNFGYVLLLMTFFAQRVEKVLLSK